MTILIILLFAVIIFSGLTVAYLMYQIDELKLENDDLKNIGLNETCNFLNASGKVFIRRKDCSIVPFKSHIAYDKNLSDFVLMIDLIEDDK